MNRIDWVRKLTSRKWWASFINFIVQTMYAMNFAQSTVERVVAMVSAAAGFIAYTIAEGFADASHAAEPQQPEQPDDIEAIGFIKE